MDQMADNRLIKTDEENASLHGRLTESNFCCHFCCSRPIMEQSGAGNRRSRSVLISVSRQYLLAVWTRSNSYLGRVGRRRCALAAAAEILCLSSVSATKRAAGCR